MKIFYKNKRPNGLLLLIICFWVPHFSLAAPTDGSAAPRYRYQEADCDEIVLRYHWLRPLPGYGESEEAPKVTAPGLLLGLGMILTAPLMLLGGGATEPSAPDTLEELELAARMKNCPEVLEQINRDLQEDNPEIPQEY